MERWSQITPDRYFDWVDQRDESFDAFIKIAAKSASDKCVFSRYSGGIKTNRDAWCYNASETSLAKDVSRMIQFYDQQIKGYPSDTDTKFKDFVDNDSTKIKWSNKLLKHGENGKTLTFDESLFGDN